MGCWWLRLANYGVGAGLLAARATHHPGFMMPQAEQHFGLELQLLSDITQFHGDGLGASIALSKLIAAGPLIDDLRGILSLCEGFGQARHSKT